MPNATTMDQLRQLQAYFGAAFTDAIKPWGVDFSMFRYEQASDAMTLQINGSLSTTVTAVKTSAARLYMVVAANGTAIPNNSTAASNTAFVQLFNATTGNVTLGTTQPDNIVKIPSNELVVLSFFTGGSANHYGTALSIAATTTSRGNTALASADQPTVWTLYA